MKQPPRRGGDHVAKATLPKTTLTWLFTRVLDPPQDTPSLTSIMGAFPVPVKLTLFNVVPDHALFAGFASDNRVAAQNHLPVLELAREIEIRAVVVHPRLTP